MLKNQTIWQEKKQKIANMDEEKINIDRKLINLGASKSLVEKIIIAKIDRFFNSAMINQIYKKIDPHPYTNHIIFNVVPSKGGLKTTVHICGDCENEEMSPVLFLSSAQVNLLSLCIFLSKVLKETNTTLNTIFMDDPIQHLDGINLLAFIDLLRNITTDLGRQVVISTHNEQFYNLLKVKMHPEYYKSKFIELNTIGEIANVKD